MNRKGSVLVGVKVLPEQCTETGYEYQSDNIEGG